MTWLKSNYARNPLMKTILVVIIVFTSTRIATGDCYWRLFCIMSCILQREHLSQSMKFQGITVVILKLNKLFILPWVFSDDEDTAVNKAEFKFLRYVTRWALEISQKSWCWNCWSQICVLWPSASYIYLWSWVLFWRWWYPGFRSVQEY